MPAMDADGIIARYGLRPHPEGGHYRETFRAPARPGERSAVSAIYYLLNAGETSAWHRIDAVEIWHYYAGAALRLSLSPDGRAAASPWTRPKGTIASIRSRFRDFVAVDETGAVSGFSQGARGQAQPATDHEPASPGDVRKARRTYRPIAREDAQAPRW